MRTGIRDFGRATALTLAVWAAGSPPCARAGDPPSYGKGYSTPTHGGRTFELIVPEGTGDAAPRSLLLLVSTNGRDDLAKSFEEVSQDGFVICAPKTKLLGVKGGGQNWAASEGPELAALAAHRINSARATSAGLPVLASSARARANSRSATRASPRR